MAYSRAFRLAAIHSPRGDDLRGVTICPIESYWTVGGELLAADGRKLPANSDQRGRAGQRDERTRPRAAMLS